MKKILITGYFVGMLLLTFIVVKATATYVGGQVEVNFRKLEHELNDTELAQHNWTPEEHVKYVYWMTIKETRTKKFFGWETKIDTTGAGYIKQTLQ